VNENKRKRKHGKIDSIVYVSSQIKCATFFILSPKNNYTMAVSAAIDWLNLFMYLVINLFGSSQQHSSITVVRQITRI